jgi:hypothetical protein
MKTDLVFKTEALFDSVFYDNDSDTWYFYFANNIFASSTGFWRLLKANRINLVSFDHGHQFGLPQPVDLSERLTKQLTGKKLTEIRVDKDTADLTLVISEYIKIQIFIASTGYESYEFSINNQRYIGMGSGNVGIVVATEKSHVFTVRVL